MKTIVVIEVTHERPIQALDEMIAGRAWSIGGVTKAEVCPLSYEQVLNGGSDDVRLLRRAGFSEGEISLGLQEVHRG